LHVPCARVRQGWGTRLHPLLTRAHHVRHRSQHAPGVADGGPGTQDRAHTRLPFKGSAGGRGHGAGFPTVQAERPKGDARCGPDRPGQPPSASASRREMNTRPQKAGRVLKGKDQGVQATGGQDAQLSTRKKNTRPRHSPLFLSFLRRAGPHAVPTPSALPCPHPPYLHRRPRVRPVQGPHLRPVLGQDGPAAGRVRLDTGRPVKVGSGGGLGAGRLGGGDTHHVR
jgi:hypothetical protein